MADWQRCPPLGIRVEGTDGLQAVLMGDAELEASCVGASGPAWRRPAPAR